VGSSQLDQWARPSWPGRPKSTNAPQLEQLAHRGTMGLSGLQWAGAPVQAHQTKPPNPVSNTPVVAVFLGARRAPAPARASGDSVAGLEGQQAVGESFPILAHAHLSVRIRQAAGGSTGSPTPTRRAASRRRALAGAQHSVPVLGCTRLARHGARTHHPCTRNTRLARRPAPGKHVTAHGTTPSGDVPVLTTARSWPWALGCGRTRTHACTQVPAETTRTA
jgi:hypothetical protein